MIFWKAITINMKESNKTVYNRIDIISNNLFCLCNCNTFWEILYSKGIIKSKQVKISECPDQ